MKTIELKIWPEFYEALEHSDPLQRKTCEIRINERDYQVGDELILHEWDNEAKAYTGRKTVRIITHMVEGRWVPEDVVVLSLAKKPAVVFVNDPVMLLVEVTKELYPGIECEVVYDPDFNEPDAAGYTIFPDDGSTPQIVLRSDRTLEETVNVLAEELAHVICGIEADHNEAFEATYLQLCNATAERWKELRSGRSGLNEMD